MKEISQILEAYDKIDFSRQKAALATVVHVEGSSYRQPGARMLVTDDGKLTGAISGGCLEGDALRKAQLVMMQQKPMLVTYDTTAEDDAKLGVGLGCNGIIHILIEPLGLSTAENQNNPINFLKFVVSRRQKAVLITLFNLTDRKANQPGTCLLYLEDGSIAGHIEDRDLQNTLLDDAKTAMTSQVSAINTLGPVKENLSVFSELLDPPVALVIIGAGNDVIPLAGMAEILGWSVTIADGRTNYATKERFPGAKHVFVVKPEKVIQNIEVDRQTVFLLMTHNYNYDLAVLRQLISRDIPFTGMLGPKKKLMRMLDELKDEGLEVSDDRLSKIFGPVGLDIGAESPEEIALSIIAEIKSVLAGRKQNSLRDRTEAIHQRHSEGVLPGI